jgi:hypothetical protein
MSDEELATALAVDGASGIWRGVREVIERYEEQALKDAADFDVPADARLGAAGRFAAGTEIWKNLEAWRREARRKGQREA